MTFQAFRGSSGAQIAFMILLATSIGDTVTQCTAHDKGVTNAVTKISGQLDHSKMHNRTCVKQQHLKYFRTPLFWETEAIFGRFGNFPHTLTHRGCVENCQTSQKWLQFLKTGEFENNIFFTFLDFFLLGLPWKIFHWLFAPKFFPDSPTFIVTPKKKFGTKTRWKFFTVAPYVEVT